MSRSRGRFAERAPAPVRAAGRRVLGAALLSVLVGGCTPLASQPRPSQVASSSPRPEPAIPAILAAFDRYDVVALPAGHGLRDVDEFILALVRDPGFPDRVDDIAVECGNSLYQAALDRYVAGMDVPYSDIRKVWRNTTQEMCGTSAFYATLFPLVRAINQRLPPEKRLRVLAADPPIDWEKVTTAEDAWKYLRRDPHIASVLEAEVLAKHRKALMLFGTFHLFHGAAEGAGPASSEPRSPASAVAIYEADYPSRTWVVSDLGTFDARPRDGAARPFASWPRPSIVAARGTSLGGLPLSDFVTPPVSVRDCKVTTDFPPDLRRPMETLVDAFLYLGPQDLTLLEPIPAEIALDADYLAELSRREALLGPPGTRPESPEQLRQDILDAAGEVLREEPAPPDVEALERQCRERAAPRAP